MGITGRFKDALSRQANEAVRIYSRPGGELTNSKSEFNHPPLSRVVLEPSWTNKARPSSAEDMMPPCLSESFLLSVHRTASIFQRVVGYSEASALNRRIIS